MCEGLNVLVSCCGQPASEASSAHPLSVAQVHRLEVRSGTAKMVGTDGLFFLPVIKRHGDVSDLRLCRDPSAGFSSAESCASVIFCARGAFVHVAKHDHQFRDERRSFETRALFESFCGLVFVACQHPAPFTGAVLLFRITGPPGPGSANCTTKLGAWPGSLIAARGRSAFDPSQAQNPPECRTIPVFSLRPPRPQFARRRVVFRLEARHPGEERAAAHVDTHVHVDAFLFLGLTGDLPKELQA